LLLKSSRYFRATHAALLLLPLQVLLLLLLSLHLPQQTGDAGRRVGIAKQSHCLAPAACLASR
jgi:hypothetical protein